MRTKLAESCVGAAMQFLPGDTGPRHGELDIIAREGDVLVFVEVKTRSSDAFGGPLDAVNGRKQRKLGRMALEYIARSRLSGVACRFDVVGVSRQGGETTIEVVADAFSI